MDKSEALELAEYHDGLADIPPASPDNGYIRRTAACLRRLRAENERLTTLLADVGQVEAELAEKSDEVHRLHAVNAELLEALDFYGRYILRNKHTREASILTPIEHDCGDRARAAIARAEGEKT